MALDIRTTYDLAQHPVDLHVLPLCDDKACKASGRYYTDEGEGLDVENKNNLYSIAYSQQKDDEKAKDNLQINFSTADESTYTNPNDILGSLEIYNAAAQLLDKTLYTAIATLKNTSTVPMGDTEAYDAVSDRLIWKAAKEQDPINLKDVNMIVFTPKK